MQFHAKTAKVNRKARKVALAVIANLSLRTLTQNHILITVESTVQ